MLSVNLLNTTSASTVAASVQVDPYCAMCVKQILLLLYGDSVWKYFYTHMFYFWILSTEEWDGYIRLHNMCSVFYFTWLDPYLAVWLATHNFHSVPLLLCCALLQLVGPKETHPAHVGAVTALRGGHEGRRNQKNLKPGEKDWREKIWTPIFMI